MERMVVFFYVRNSITNQSLHDTRGLGLCCDVVVIDLMKETVASNVISRSASGTMKLNTITKIQKYKGLHVGHHFIPMAMEVHDTFEHDMDHFIRECGHLFHDRRLGDHLSLSFYIQFFRQC
jgi:hypothetical protein